MRSTPGSSRSRPQRMGRFAMRREGSPWQGLGTVLLKELADHLDSIRMPLLTLLMVATAAVPFYIAVERLRSTTEAFPVLKLFNPGEAISVVQFLAFVLPVI